MKKMFFLMVLVAAVLMVADAQAVIVVAEPGATGNTVRTSDGGTDWMGSGVTATTWRDRSDWAGSAPGLPIAAYDNSGDSTAPELRTTIGGFEEFEEVEVWVLFSTCYNADGSLRKNNWVDAAVDDGSAMTAFSIQAGNAVGTGLISREEFKDDALFLYYEVAAGYMGTVMADDSGIISLLADSRVVAPEGSDASNGDRSIFHGYAFYEAPVPEPATMALFGFGGLALLRKRK